MVTASGRVCAAYRLPIARELDLGSSGHQPPRFMKLSDDVQQLSQYNDDVVPQPEHKSQSVAASVERAMGASHGTAGWVCKAAGHAADLARLMRLRSARRSLHREIVGAVQGRIRNLCVKGF